MEAKILKLKEITSKITDIKNAIAVLNWDQETYMPNQGQKYRAQQIATLNGIAHNLSTSEEYASLLKDLSTNNNLSNKDEKNINLLLRDYNKAKKLSEEFVIKQSKATSSSFHAWIQARKENDFNILLPELENMVKIQQEKADIYGYDNHIYNALMDDYEPGATVQDLDLLFQDVRNQLQPLITKIAAAKDIENNFMYGHFDKDKQWNFGIDILKQLGYNFEAGRQDISEHPFSTAFNPLDVRITTRIKEDNLYDMIWSCIHECGHALYEQGLSIEQYGLPCGEAVSLGIHESQSRFYENNIGRSLAFWELNYSKIQQTFPQQLKNVELNGFYKAVNIVKPSFIRTDADELTYHFHIMIRYEIEKQLIEGSLLVKDVKEAWNAAYKKYLNIDVPDDNMGILQDVHWSHGGFGYFPTYSLGSFYAAQFEAKMHQDIPTFNHDIKENNFTNILAWLRTNIHQHGRYYSAEDLCKNATGEKLNFKYFMNYASEKYATIYSL